MNIKFTKIHLHNFASYQDEIVELDDLGLTLVNGRNNCKLDNAYSNGSGKSAIFNGLCYAITGETTQGVSSGIENIFTDPDDCWVSVEMTIDGDDFLIKRIKTPKQNMKVFINGEDHSGKGIRESSQVLSNYIPDLTPELLNSIIILGQGLPSRFTNNRPSHRKELLENLTKSDFMIQSIKNKLECRLADLRYELRENENQKISAESGLSVYQKRFSDLDGEINNCSKYGDNLDTEIADTSLLLNSVTNNINDLTEKIRSLELDLSNLMTIKSNLFVEKNQEISSASSEFSEKILELKNKLIETNSEISSKERRINDLKSITDICPTCGQVIKNVESTRSIREAEINELTLSLESLYKIKTDLEDESKRSNESIMSQKAEIEERYKSKTEEIQLQISSVQSTINTSKSKIATSNKNKDELTKKYYDLLNFRDNYKKLKDELDNTWKCIKEKEEEIQQITTNITKVNSHLDVIQQMITLAKREFRGILLLNVIKYIDKKVKQYSEEVFGTDKLSFTLNDNHIDITYCDKLYENLSGGEKQKIDIIIQLALRDILSKQLNIHSNILVLDEIYDNADAISCQKITNLISTLTDISSVFIISHHVQDLGITYDNQLLVEKSEQGISSIKFV